MSPYTDAKQRALALPDHERLALAEEILASVDIDARTIDNWNSECAVRLARYDAGETVAFDFEEVLQEFENATHE